MNRILIIAHAPLASALKSAALHVFPNADARIAAVDVLPDEATDQTLCKARHARQLLIQSQPPTNDKAGTLVISDVFGATPCNVAKQLVDGVEVRCVAGASLPMLLRAITYWNEPLSVMAERAVTGGTQGAMELASQ